MNAGYETIQMQTLRLLPVPNGSTNNKNNDEKILRTKDITYAKKMYTWIFLRYFQINCVEWKLLLFKCHLDFALGTQSTLGEPSPETKPT